MFPPLLYMYKKMQENDIDLNLAINYLPACITVFKTVILLACMEFLYFLENYGGMVFICMVLLTDRLYATRIIFDGNSILLLVFLGYVTMAVRDQLLHPYLIPFPFIWILQIIWMLFSLYLQSIDGCISFVRLRVYFIISSVFISLMPYCSTHHTELRSTRILRGFVFCLLSLVWIYIIGIYKRRMTKAHESSVHFVIYFSPCLFIHPVAAFIFCVIVMCVVTWKIIVGATGTTVFKSYTQDVSYTMRGNYSSDLESIAEEPKAISVNTFVKTEDVHGGTLDNDTEELQMLLRQAKERAKTGGITV